MARRAAPRSRSRPATRATKPKFGLLLLRNGLPRNGAGLSSQAGRKAGAGATPNPGDFRQILHDEACATVINQSCTGASGAIQLQVAESPSARERSGLHPSTAAASERARTLR